jgi:outer membrane translocation and assembly module TamA
LKLSLRHTFPLLLLLVILAESCSITRRVGHDEFFLDKNEVIIDGTAPGVDAYDLSGILKQKTNRKTASLFRFNLRIHNMPDAIETQHRIIIQHKKLLKKNLKRLKHGKDTLEYSPTISEWLLFTVGERPMIIDTNLVHRSTEQLELYMQKNGYFRASVRDSVVYNPKKKKAEAYYIVTPGKAYTIDTVIFESNQPELMTLYKQSLTDNEVGHTRVHKGDIYDVDKLDQERTRITKFLKNRGYFDFGREHIAYEVDSALNNNTVSIRMRFKPMFTKQFLPNGSDTLVKGLHEYYKIGYVIFYTDYDPKGEKSDIDDPGLKMYKHIDNKGREYRFLYKDTLKIEPILLMASTFFKPKTGFYKDKYVERTYKRFSSLGVFSSVSVTFRPHEDMKDRKRLDCVVYLTPAQRKYFSAEASAINQGGNPGISGNLIFTNKNAFGGGEQLKVSLTGGFEAQQTLTETESSSEDETLTNSVLNSLNTMEIGAEVSIRLPKFPVSWRKVEDASNTLMPFTYFKSGGNFQVRPDYTRRALNAGLSMEFREGKDRIWKFPVLNATFLQIDKSDAFQVRIDTTNDILLQNSYQDLLMGSLGGGVTFNTDQRDSWVNKNHRFYIKADFELSGILFSMIDRPLGFETLPTGEYTILRVPYTDYVRVDGSIIYTYKINKHNSFAARLYAGVGHAQFDLAGWGTNVDALPFERAFFSGGANGMRGWKARQLGPGSFFDAERAFDKIGDVQMELSAEGRFDIIGPLELGLFVDAGNIWLLNPDDLRPGAEFHRNTFLPQVAFDAGVGFRFDFDFFLIRADIAWPLKDPGLPAGERWLWEPKDVYHSWPVHNYRYYPNFNLGIGLPF